MLRISPPSRSLLSSMASGAPRGWLPTLAQRVASVRAVFNPPVRHVSRFPHGSRNMAISSRVKGKELGKPDRRMDNEENRAAIEEFIAHYGDGGPANNDDGSKISMYGDEDVYRTIDPSGAVKDVGDGEDEKDQGVSKVSDDNAYEEFTDCEDNYPRDGSVRWTALRRSSHHDGSIYCTRGTFGSGWKNDYRIADRNETRLEAMMLSDPNKDCILVDGTCRWHRAQSMLQIFSVKLAKISVVDGPVQLYGYIAARDLVDPLLNYIVNIGRDDPITVEKGSLIETTGPKRGIELSCNVLIEYDMRIKTGEQEKGDLQLIDGVSIVDELLTSSNPWTNRIHGDCGAIDITQMCIDYAFEATVEVVISEVQSSFDLLLSCFTSGLHEEIRLFDGVIGKSLGLRRHVLAVRKGKCMDLKFKVGFGSDCCTEHCRSFEATNHGCSSEQIKMESALVLVKVTWSSLEYSLN
ncbi:unnamed protein product [Miscanthus lutarioriparius]|uniref:DUF6598 domain-containing protein n=1 Tax=Miscanthus lutarioriparius TaxID=422564 RepID=A0A811QBA7_9POAL|nr:unnamed protein product [Miscanthus lutarioriparius]